MPIWRGQSAVPTSGPQIHLKFSAFGLGSSYKEGAGDAVGMARIMLRQILSLLHGGAAGLTADQRGILDYYFVFSAATPSSADITTIRTTLQMTYNGLSATGLNLKVTKSGDAMGYVNMHDKRMGLADQFRAKLKINKGKWTPGKDIDDGTNTHFGDIHLDTDRLDTGVELSAKTVIHEATHKFASTTDFGEKGYTNDTTGLFRAAGLTHAEALNNAESYARFVMMAFLFPNG